jgi:Flp pilus assembly pilin Flp
MNPSASALVRAKIRGAYRCLVDFVRDEDGSPLVEFTLLAPLIFLVVFAITEWGNIFYIQNNMYNAARLAVRQVAYGTIANTSTAAIAAACSSPSPIYGTGYTYTFTYTSNYGCPSSGYPLTSPSYGTVTLTIKTPAAAVAIVNYRGLIGGENLSASATMMQEYVCPAAESGPTTVSQTC